MSRGRIGVTIQEVTAATAENLGLDRPRGAAVASVESGGPADKAGIRVDDVLLAINNSFNGNMQLYKNLLQNAGDKLKIIVSRDGQLMTFNLVVRSIR